MTFKSTFWAKSCISVLRSCGVKDLLKACNIITTFIGSLPVFRQFLSKVICILKLSLITFWQYSLNCCSFSLSLL
ncbi:unnamed protein product [Moneuplotes crassus]|uniref:Uncharacterized protein n=1 Tax=Euplotes crassus TaxID=5936 RepID=A0AAD1UNP5_EUPCR|nr:unnamed protein product [Moneuplotes crassus]